uniref:Uncharacterized protein n=1 Tax=Podoviridae sp. cthau23 TaxID=2825268 RepID=A0A8S5U764_9CAUD|nr:MAG TPA: hypothetical protein [Podoviridae sp. cthau23]
MKNTKANQIKVIRAMYANTHAMRRKYEEIGETEKARRELIRATELSSVLMLLENNEHFHDIANIYFPDED